MSSSPTPLNPQTFDHTLPELEENQDYLNKFKEQNIRNNLLQIQAA
jgi:hypothetical protein